MRIAFVCKRRYMGKDVILDRYARLYEIPRQLALLGHEVEGICLDYRPGTKAGGWKHDAAPGRLQWQAHAPGPLGLGMAGYPWQVLRHLRAFAPDLVIGASDIPQVALGAWLAKRLRVPFVADLYDNFEGFGQARIPGMVGLLRRAVRRAALVLTTSEQLRGFVEGVYRPAGSVMAMPSSVDKRVFRPRDRRACREALGLPVDAKLFGTAGGLHPDKGVTTLYAAWERLRRDLPDAHLVLAGPHEAALPPPQGARVHYLGALSHDRVADLFGALDVGAICVLDTAFGRYCFPQKAYEMLACGLPVVAANVGAMGELLADVPDCLYRAGDAEDLAARIGRQLAAPVVPRVPIKDWQELIGEIEPRLRSLVAENVAVAG
ncbi:glycosyltransferase family 4 protein [Frateuria hangzhouensis]|uniref:glycosyltransferase family 4 protein n=1 Tax=Frateuria hangzhouensis TaxID=2995589 RepID=UPI002260CFF0|nr:glycosyltransferase family 4 protein [Frateuria sp. STR12]MCX7513743.1 glycosyltransferase family 4 protein [Frateuria sp. STR12]